ncbi:MAG TPA: hypothetical protein VF690_08720 [Hymenobacter sp.]
MKSAFTSKFAPELDEHAVLGLYTRINTVAVTQVFEAFTPLQTR